MKTALIFGIDGQDGYYLSSFLKEKNYRVIGYSGDIRSHSIVENTIEKTKPIEIYNLVGQVKDRISFEYPYDVTSVICDGTLNILESIQKINPDIKYFQSSSSEIYGKVDGVVNEETDFNPLTPYASARLFSQNLVNSYRDYYGMHCSCGILFNHESPRRDETYVTRKITSTVAKIKLGLVNSLSLDNVGVIKDFGFAGDYVRAMWMMLQEDCSDNYIISTGIGTTILEFVNKVFKHAGIKNIDKHFSFKSIKSYGVLGDNTKIKKKLKWTPDYSVDKLIEMMYTHDIERLLNEN